jgi:hypothetical protein
MSAAYRITRDLTRAECPWLDEPIKAGAIVYSYDKYTWGCLSDDGRAVTWIRDREPFFEVPRDALEPKSPWAGSGRGAI